MGVAKPPGIATEPLAQSDLEERNKLLSQQLQAVLSI